MKKKKPGFTLIEMIIVIALTTIVLGIISSIFITGNRVFSDSDNKTSLQMEAQVIQEKISTIGMQAKGVIATSSTEMMVNSYDKDGKEQKFSIKKDRDSIRIVTYDVDGKQVSSPTVYEHVSKLEIVYKPDSSNPDAIDINLELSEEHGFSHATHPVNFSVTFRNKGMD